MNYSTIPTVVGAAKLRNASLLGQKVDITRVAFGDGDGAEYEPTGQETTLKKQIYECPPNRIEEESGAPSWIELEAVIPHNVGGWYLREVGCFDDEGDLIFIGNLPSSFKPSGEAGVIKDLVFEMVYDAVAANVVQIKIDPNVVIATRKYVDDQDKAHTDNAHPHPQYAKENDVSKLIFDSQFLPYDSQRTYAIGEVCYTKNQATGELSYWQWYSNVESLAGKNPLTNENRQSGWTDDTKPFYWTPYKKSRPGAPLWPWMSMTFPEGTLNVLGNSVPVAVFWRLAAAFPEFVNQGTGMIDFPEARGEFFRVLDQGRGVDTNRTFGSSQLDAFQGHSRILRRSGGGTDTVHGLVNVSTGGDYKVPTAQGTGDVWKPAEYTDDGHGSPRVGYETRSRNLAFPLLVEV